MDSAAGGFATNPYGDGAIFVESLAASF
jgi:hypothetical protein